MSTLTAVWTEDKIRSIIRKLDEKTDLNGAALPIKLASHGNALGYYQYVGENKFGFKPNFFNDPNTKEAEAVDVIRHEYAHYYVDATNISRYFTRKGSSRGHNTDWKWACKMVGADPTSYHRKEIFEDKNWTENDAMEAYCAKDVPTLNINEFVSRWNQVPLDADKSKEIISRIKTRKPEEFYQVGDEVVHMQRGFGAVEDVIPYEYCAQKVYVRFEDKSTGVYLGKELFKVIDGVVITPKRPK